MNEHELANKIVRPPESGARTPSSKVPRISCKRRARRRLTITAKRRSRVFGLAWAGEVAFRIGHSRHVNARNLLALGLMVLSLIGVAYWQMVIQANDIAEIDASLLTDELPINAYLDNNFEAWLKRSSQ